MRKFNKIIFILLAVICTMAKGNAQSFSQREIDAAMTYPIMRTVGGPNVNTELWKEESVGRDKAFYYLALVSHLNVNTKSSDGKLTADRVVEDLKNIVSLDADGKSQEPSCRGDLVAWKDLGEAFAIVLAKNTPEIWSELTPEEINKLDWLMRAFAVAGNYNNNYKNLPSACIYQTYGIGKLWNPNHNDGYVGIMMACYYYFGGAEAVNDILANFKYDEYIAMFRKLHFNNIEETWTAAGTKRYPKGKNEGFMKDLLEDPDGTMQLDKKNGKVYGARMPFVFGSPPRGIERVPYEPLKLYRAVNGWMFSNVVTNVSRSGAAYILGNGSSPMLGKFGMCREFQITDGFAPNVGERSDAQYCWWGWMMHQIMVSGLMALDKWPKDDAMKDQEQRMFVGSEDLIYKLHKGYHSFSKGEPNEHHDYKLTGQGYWIMLDVWDNYVKPKISKDL